MHTCTSTAPTGHPALGRLFEGRIAGAAVTRTGS